MCAAQKPKKARREKPLLETVSDDGSCSFAKALGSVDFHTRERGLQALTVFLRTSQKLTPLAMRKLWKGLFYCFWHSDKAPAQVCFTACHKALSSSNTSSENCIKAIPGGSIKLLPVR